MKANMQTNISLNTEEDTALKTNIQANINLNQ